MPLTQQEKQALVESYQSGLARAPHVFLIDYKGISVPQATELRQKLRETGGSYVVVKNRLALRAIEGAALEGLSAHFQGPTAAAFCDDDPISLAKALTEFAKEAPALDLKAGLVDGQQVVPNAGTDLTDAARELLAHEDAPADHRHRRRADEIVGEGLHRAVRP